MLLRAAAAAAEPGRSAREARAVRRFLRVFKTAHAKVHDFRTGRARQPDDGFLRDCGIEPGTETARVAVAVRRAVAEVGLVDPLFVRAEDSYPGTLEVLPLWDSMDWLAFLFELERELGQKVRWESAGRPAMSCPITVGDMVARVRELLAQPEAAEPGAAPDRGR